MKSFFKKLAFVMAMAMVVSLAAPAAASAAVEGWEKTYLAYQGKTAKVTTHSMTEGDEVDFCFKKAPSNWQSKKFKKAWQVVNLATDEVVKGAVNSSGLVKIDEAGDYAVQYVVNGEAVASTFIKVNPVVPVNEYKLAQSTHEAFTLTYANKVDYKIADVKLELLRTTTTGELLPIEWPLDTAKSKVSGNVITIVPAYVTPASGLKFRVTVDGVAKEGVYEIGDVTKIEIVEKNNKDTVFAKETNKDTADKFHLTYSYKVYSGEVDLTEYFNNNDLAKIEWDLKTQGNTKDLYFSRKYDPTFTVGFYSVMDGSVSLKITDKDKKTYEAEPVLAYAEKQPDWALDLTNVVWTITNGSEKIDWANPVHKIPADAKSGEYFIVLKFESTRGDKYVTHQYGKKVVDSDKNTYTSFDTLRDYKLEFSSVKEKELLLDKTTAALGVYKETEVMFYVTLKDSKTTNYVCADYVKVTERTNLGSIEVDTKTTNANGNVIVDNAVEITTLTMDGFANLAKKTVYLTAKTKATETAKEAVWASSNVKYTVEVSHDKAKDAVKLVNGNAIEIDGAKLIDVDARAVTVYVTATSRIDNATQAFTEFDILINSVIVYDADRDKDVSKEFVVNAANSSDKIILDTDYVRDLNEYAIVKIGDGDFGEVKVDLNAKNSSNGVVYAEIKLYKTSNGQIVGQYGATDNILVVSSKDDLKKAEFTTEGARYIEIKKGDTYLTGEWVGNVLKVPFNSTKDGEMVYSDLGTYDIKVTTVRYDADRDYLDYHYEVYGSLVLEDTTPSVKYVGTKNGAKYTAGKTVEQIVVETLKFNLGNDEWKDLSAAMIVPMVKDVDYIQVGSTIIIRNVTIKVPVDGKSISKPYYMDYEFDINAVVEAK